MYISIVYQYISMYISINIVGRGSAVFEGLPAFLVSSDGRAQAMSSPNLDIAAVFEADPLIREMRKRCSAARALRGEGLKG